MFRCEACGGDGLIEVGAYRGDEDDADTRPCRLCGGVVTLETYREQVSGERKVTTTFKDEHGQMRTLHEILPPKAGSAAEAGRLLSRLGQTAASAGRSILPLPEGVSYVTGVAQEVPNVQDWAKRTANEYDERLRRENEQRQRDAEVERYESTLRSTDAIMNKFLRDKFGD